jgi:hypothetical protein
MTIFSQLPNSTICPVMLAAEGSTRLPVYYTVAFGLVLPNSVALYTGQAYEGLATLDNRWIACRNKSRCQLSAQPTGDVWCV